MWVVVHGKDVELAIGVTYMALDKHKEWNDELEESLMTDIAQLKEEGKKVLVLGDFNEHISAEDGGVAKSATKCNNE